MLRGAVAGAAAAMAACVAFNAAQHAGAAAAPRGGRGCADAVDAACLPPPRHAAGWVSVPAGEAVLLTGVGGAAEVVEGPAWRAGALGTVQPLRRVAASRTEALSVRGVGGEELHLPGPAAAWFNPLEHARLSVLRPIELQGGEAVVVYRKEPGGDVTRRVVTGPALFLAAPSEWLHAFRWHGRDPNNSDMANKVSDMLRFTKLRTGADRMYFNVDSMRSSDDALLQFKLMLFYELVDVPKMLDGSRDVVADMMAAATADAVEFTANRTFERCKADAAALNDLATYHHLTQRARSIGYRLDKVVFRGYVASDSLQQMHDGAIERRTRLHLERETEEQEQELRDFKQRRGAARAAQAREEEALAARHRTEIDDAEAAAALGRGARQEAQRLSDRRAAAALALEELRNATAAGADATRYAVAQAQGRPTRLVSVEAPGAALHVHDRD